MIYIPNSILFVIGFVALGLMIYELYKKPD